MALYVLRLFLDRSACWGQRAQGSAAKQTYAVVPFPHLPPPHSVTPTSNTAAATTTAATTTPLPRYQDYANAGGGTPPRPRLSL